MRPSFNCLAAVVLAAVPAVTIAQPVNFDSSLHATRVGKNFWYGAENGGFEAFTGVPIEELGCIECHGPADANGDPYDESYAPNCADCHQTATDWAVTEDACYACHGRQKAEAFGLGYSDVHRDAGIKCWECHQLDHDDIHGDGTEYESMLEPMAIAVACEDCHDTLPPEHTAYDPPGHMDRIDCKACHTQSVVSCYNCHFESLVPAHIKRAYRPLGGFVMLVNREEDGQVHPATFQSLTNEGDSFVAFAPYTAHTITDVGRACTECHNTGGSNAAITQYNETGQIRFAEWDDDDAQLSWLTGIVPIPEDYEETLRMDFLTYTGDPTSPETDPSLWEYICEDTWDGSHMFFATPLTSEQMAKLGFEMTLFCPADFDDDRTVGFNDLVMLLGDWGGCRADLDGDASTGFNDLAQLLGNWGPCP